MNQYRWNKQNTAESQRLKIYVQNVHHSRKHMHSNDYTTVQSLPWWWCGPAASTRSADILSTPHHGSANCRPSLEEYPDAVVHRIQMWQIGWPHLWRDKLLASISASGWQCHVHGERQDFSDVHITSPGMYMARNVINIPVWLVFICKVMYQKS